MDSFKFGLFDVFGYALPGFVTFLSIILMFQDLSPTVEASAIHFSSIAKDADINTIFLGFVLSYVIGFVQSPFGFTYFNWIGKRLWKKMLKGYEEPLSSLVHQGILIRHFSKGNLNFADICSALRAMSFNLSLGFLWITFITVIKLIRNELFGWDWFFLVVVCICISAVTLNRAASFHLWTVRTLRETITVLKLDRIDPTKGGDA